MRTLPDKVVVQINDTHPAFAIPELMRILLDEVLAELGRHGIVSRIFNYTNHTVMRKRWRYGGGCSGTAAAGYIPTLLR